MADRLTFNVSWGYGVCATIAGLGSLDLQLDNKMRHIGDAYYERFAMI
jgi:hypothetical protein